ncbi:hypothetical protein BDV93DRAFT_554513 [Ceratobasidium sp. AG-I]|nr:hypothetical protein BDV93DRAFT_554513 [Ceratobasidium sp. AG-I]
MSPDNLSSLVLGLLLHPSLRKHSFGLHCFFGSNMATWTCQHQVHALVDGLKRKALLLCRLPTSGGKSLLLGALHYPESAVTVLVFTYFALLLERLSALKGATSGDP